MHQARVAIVQYRTEDNTIYVTWVNWYYSKDKPPPLNIKIPRAELDSHLRLKPIRVVFVEQYELH